MPQQVIIQFNRDVQRYIFPDNSFYKESMDDSTAQVIGQEGTPGKVQVPQEGLAAEGGKNPENFPLPLQNVKDDIKEYNVNWLYTKPRRIGDWQDMQTNYNRRQNEVRNHAGVLNTLMAQECLENWAPTLTDFIVRTSGTTTRSGKTKATPAGTGTRKQLTYEDVLKAMEICGEWDVELEGRNALFPAVMLGDLFGDLKKAGAFVAYTDLQTALIRGGRIGKLLTFEVWTRSVALLYTNDSAPAPKLFSAAAAAADNHAALFWHRDLVRRYEGRVKFFESNQAAEHQADLVSAGCWGGASKGRIDERGVVAIVQAHG